MISPLSPPPSFHISESGQEQILRWSVAPPPPPSEVDENALVTRLPGWHCRGGARPASFHQLQYLEEERGFRVGQGSGLGGQNNHSTSPTHISKNITPSSDGNGQRRRQRVVCPFCQSLFAWLILGLEPLIWFPALPPSPSPSPSFAAGIAHDRPRRSRSPPPI